MMRKTRPLFDYYFRKLGYKQDISVQAVGQHIKRTYSDGELSQGATIKKYFIVQNEGGRLVGREVAHYNLQMIIAVGFKGNNERAIQFRRWANQIVRDYTIQGWVMDEERLKNGSSILTKEYFEKQLEKIREIRMSERRFYQKITDIEREQYKPLAFHVFDSYSSPQCATGHAQASMVTERNGKQFFVSLESRGKSLRTSSGTTLDRCVRSSQRIR